ncbi:VOC family protein [Phytohabitans sp. ZYX-F-186]|uniref:VOC family protein n=1 Tax=Phytohabitans maris TaxID=3071409 RepID=A0ABU0Z7D3_9ACTN|nr:VOC family protein [Phytohabitans sp. ZYX-F-186]MDQ7902903.1 VOC family protein [Phytohabitans sp. ZYX-F-186]
MADARRRPIAPVRKLVAAVLGTFAVFVMLFGAGMQSWAIVAVGLAVLVLAISMVLVNTIRGGARAWVAGTAHVMTATEPPASSTYGRCELQIVIDAPGLPAASIKVRESRVPVAKWPLPGVTLPIMVAVDDLRHVRILWDEALTHTEAAARLEPEQDYLPESDDILFEEDEPPWSRRGPDEPVTADLTDDLGGGIRDEPVVVHQPTPGGPIVLEGIVVEPPSGGEARSVPLPRRARSNQDKGNGNGAAATAVADPASAPESSEPLDPTPAEDDVFDDFTPYPSAHPGPSGSIHGVGVTVLVTDLARSIEFYRDMLGFYEIDGGDGNAVLASGDTRLVLRAITDLSPAGPRTVHLNLEVGDITATHEELKAKGVKFTYGPRPVNKGAKLELWAAAFKDPDGHGIAITQWRNRAEEADEQAVDDGA